MRKFDDSLPLRLLKAREAAMGFFRPMLQEIPLTEQQWRVIRALYEFEELESKQLAELCSILSPSLTGIINRLEQQGYINRRKSPEDQRRILISLTDTAKTMFARMSPRVEARYQEMTERFSHEDMKALEELLTKFCNMKP